MLDKNMKPEERLLKIEENFLLLKALHLKTDDKIYLGKKEDETCRFCSKKYPKVTFNKIAHAIPEFTNNHTLFSYYECDDCNEKFARTLETHMGDYMNPYHTLSQVRGKKGVPSYRKGGEKSRIDLRTEGLHIESHHGERDIFEFDEKNKTLTIKSIRATYIPVAIYKCLTKMALSIIDKEELIFFNKTIEWINEENHNLTKYKFSNLPCFYSFTPGPLPHNFTSCLLFKRKEKSKDKVNYITFLLAYGNYTFQILLPLCSLDSGELTLTAIPNPFDFNNSFGKPEYKVFDLSSIEKVRNEEVTIQMHFDDFIKEDFRDKKD